MPQLFFLWIGYGLAALGTLGIIILAIIALVVGWRSWMGKRYELDGWLLAMFVASMACVMFICAGAYIVVSFAKP